MVANNCFWKANEFPSKQLKEALEQHNSGRSKAGMQVDGFDVQAARNALGPTGRTLPENVKTSDLEIAGVRCRLVEPEDTEDDQVLIYIHGGGYCAGSWESHQGHASWLSAFSRKRVVFPEYRLAPEHVYPGAFDDCFNVLTSVMDEGLLGKKVPVAIAGDSAGAGLAVAITYQRIAQKLSTPIALALMCGMFDLNPGTADYLINYGRAREMAALYVGDSDPKDPLISPVFADLTGFPPMLIQIGGGDYIKDDSVRLADNAILSGVPVTIEHWPEMPHVWQRFVPDVPEAKLAIERVAQFLVSSL